MPRRFRRRFGAHSAVTQSTCVLKRKSKCRGCGHSMNVGETATRLRLKKSIAANGCPSCSRKLVKLKNFHPACCPADINKAMGYDPAAHTASTNPHASCPPPPKPKTSQDLDLEALATLEAALLARVRPKMRMNPLTHKMELPPDIEKAFKTFQNIKARVLRPGTPGEGEAATNVAIKRIVDLVFA